MKNLESLCVLYVAHSATWKNIMLETMSNPCTILILLNTYVKYVISFIIQEKLLRIILSSASNEINSSKDGLICWWYLLGLDSTQLNDYIEKYPQGGPKSHFCKLCGKVCSDKSNIKKHLENIHIPDSFVHNCKYCNQLFSTRNMLYMHMSKMHKNQKK